MTDYILKPLEGEYDSKLTNYPSLVRRLLLLRGITEENDAELFLNPDWNRDIHDPFLMKDVKRAVQRILEAIEKEQTIAIWSDYDMDGIPGAVVLYDFFREIGYEHVVHYTPHRNKEGFGLNKGGIDALRKKCVKLMVTIDCGIADSEMVAYASECGMEVIVTDHHLPSQTIPDAYAILNPKQETCEYPEKMLCGAGVVFKLVQALVHASRNDETIKSLSVGREKWLLDMVGMATVADMVPLTGENRALAHFGLVVLRKSRRVGLQALLKKARADQRRLSEDDIAFTIAPRINAASRMGHAQDAFALLSSTDAVEAGVLAGDLDKINTARKTQVAVMKRETKRKLAKKGNIKSVIVLGNPEWKPSLLGLVASSLAEEYKRPVFLWGREGGNVIKGSCRSDGECNIFELMQTVEERFVEYGGHAFSGGFSLEENQVHTLEDALAEAYDVVSKGNGEGRKMYDEKLRIDDVTWNTFREMNRLSPFGEGNPKPLFLFSDVTLVEARQFGKGHEHLELSLKKHDGGVVKAIAFFATPESFGTVFHSNTVISFVAHLEASYFMGRSEIRLRLVDVI